MAFWKKILLILGIIFLLLSEGSALYCYYCNDFKTGLLNCSDPFSYHNKGVKLQLCGPGHNVCYKYSITHMGHIFHARSCHPDEVLGCYQRGNVSIGQVLECFCKGDFCNHAVKVQENDIVSLLTKFLFVLHMIMK